MFVVELGLIDGTSQPGVAVMVTQGPLGRRYIASGAGGSGEGYGIWEKVDRGSTGLVPVPSTTTSSSNTTTR